MWQVAEIGVQGVGRFVGRGFRSGQPVCDLQSVGQGVPRCFAAFRAGMGQDKIVVKQMVREMNLLAAMVLTSYRRTDGCFSLDRNKLVV